MTDEAMTPIARNITLSRHERSTLVRAISEVVHTAWGHKPFTSPLSEIGSNDYAWEGACKVLDALDLLGIHFENSPDSAATEVK